MSTNGSTTTKRPIGRPPLPEGQRSGPISIACKRETRTRINRLRGMLAAVTGEPVSTDQVLNMALDAYERKLT